MNDMIVKQFEGQDVRVIGGDDPWFVLADVLKALGTSTPVGRAVSVVEQGLGKGFTNSQPLQTAGGKQRTVLVQHPAVTLLVSRSNTENGRRLNRWIHAEVIPSIRQHGGYIAGQETDDPALIMARGIQAAQSIIEQKTAQLAAAHSLIEEQQPKADALDRLSTADGLTCVTDAAKLIQVRPLDLFNYLRENKWIYRRVGGKGNVAYQNRIQQGLLRHKVHPVEQPDGSVKMYEDLKVTAKGITVLAKAFGKPDPSQRQQTLLLHN